MMQQCAYISRPFDASTAPLSASPVAMVTTPVKKKAGDTTMDAYHTQLFVTPSGNSTRPRRSPPSSGASSRLGDCPSTGSSKRSQHAVYNPFEAGLLDRLHGPVFSPSVFAKAQCPGSEEKTPKHFRWSIDQLAILMPVEIEETAVQPTDSYDHPVQVEAQRAIDTFFVMQPVLPSPWTDSAKRKPFQLPRTPGAESEGCSPAMAAPSSSSTAHTREASCQTTLSLPSDFDLTKVLAEYHSETVDELPTTPADLSTSSLRRKLFFHGDDGTPLSPVRDRVSFQSCSVTPPDVATGSDRLVSPSDGPLCQFSSSPIHRMSSDGGSDRGRHCESSWLHHCSTVPDVMASPQLSPVVQRQHEERADRRSSFDGSFSWSMTPGSPTPRCRPQAVRVSSPDMSPITTSLTPLSRTGGQGRNWMLNRDCSLNRDRSGPRQPTTTVTAVTNIWCSDRGQEMDVDMSSSCLPPDGASSHDTGYSTAASLAHQDSAPAEMTDDEEDGGVMAHAGRCDLTHPFSRMATGDGKMAAAAWCVGPHAHVRPSEYVEELLRHAKEDINKYCEGSTVPRSHDTIDRVSGCSTEPAVT